MGSRKGFIDIPRRLPERRSVAERLSDYHEIYERFPYEALQQQGARCMDCGIPFCTSGCPLGNMIPDFNDLVYRGRWREAYERLRATNNFPEFTGRICPAPCEAACVLGYTDEAVTIEQIERDLAERAFEEGWVTPRPPRQRTGRTVAVIGSGPAGLAAADQLNQAGHKVTVYERADAVGGLLRYGIPDFKLDKAVLDRRVAIMEAEGVVFRTGQTVGRDLTRVDLDAYTAVVVCVGSTIPRDLSIEGRDLDGVHFAMDYLEQQNRRVADRPVTSDAIDARGKHVVVIGGGDTGSDCIGTANRQGAEQVTQFEILVRPPEERTPAQPWPYYPMLLKETTSHEEGADRQWQIMTERFIGEGGRVTALETVQVKQTEQGLERIPGTRKQWPADLVLLAIGYTGPEKPLVDHLGLAKTGRGTIETDDCYRTSRLGYYAAGDARRGQSLVVWAISEGREAARHLDADLMARSWLPTKGRGDLVAAPLSQ